MELVLLSVVEKLLEVVVCCSNDSKMRSAVSVEVSDSCSCLLMITIYSVKLNNGSSKLLSVAFACSERRCNFCTQVIRRLISSMLCVFLFLLTSSISLFMTI